MAHTEDTKQSAYMEQSDLLVHLLINRALPRHFALFILHYTCTSDPSINTMDPQLTVGSMEVMLETTFYYSGIKDWNSLPSDVKQKCTFNGFKSAVRQYLRSLLQLMESVTYIYY